MSPNYQYILQQKYLICHNPIQNFQINNQSISSINKTQNMIN